MTRAAHVLGRGLMLAVLLAVGLPASAQSFPKVEQYLGFNVYNKVKGAATSHIETRRGISTSTTRNFSPVFGVTTNISTQLDFGFSAKRGFGFFPAVRGSEIMMGPQVSLRPGKWNLFARYLSGLSRQRMNAFNLSAAQCAARGLDCGSIGGILQPNGSFQFERNSAFKFGTATGFGIDYKVGNDGALRLLQVDFLKLRSVDPTVDWRKLWRVEFGIVKHF